VLAVVAAFLVFNFPLGFNRPVRTFMGDAGSTFLGLAIACIGIALCQGDSPRMSPVIGLWLIAVPVFDLFSAILRRVMDGKSPFAPDHEHLHHVLVANQVSNRSTLGVMLALATVYAILGIAGHFLLVSEGIMVIAWFCAFLLYYQLMRHPQLVVRFVIALGASGDREGRQHPETS
jgi:UDP-GlcNAc:undecaprenyl-phosphate GlcNAc-1-phosphate transferase